LTLFKVLGSIDKLHMADSKSDETVTGSVEEVLPNSLFRVRIESGELLLAYLAGKMRLHRIRVLVGDQVELVTDPYGGRARVVRRLS
jgi:translation initiation factor IF-1